MASLYYVLASAVAGFVVTVILTVLSIDYLKKRNFLVVDYHKKDKPMVPKPAGPALFVGISLPLLALFVFTSEIKYLAVLSTIAIIFSVGFIDDIKVLSGKLKTSLTLLGSFPLLFFGAYDSHILFPIFGSTRLTIVYPLLILLVVPVIANAMNMVDVYNGTLSGTCIVLAFAQILPLLFYGHLEDMVFPLLLLGSSSAFFIFNRYPSRIFAGDSGSLTLGALFGVSAIITKTEIPSLIAFVPAILNGFYILASIRGIIEHRSIKVRPVQLNDDGMLVASKEKSAPVTLARLVVADGPMSERQASNRIILLFVYSTILAVVTSLLIEA